MRCLKQVSQVVLLSVLAGGACTASEQIQKEGVTREEASVQALHAGIELVVADSGVSVAEKPPMILFYVTNTSDDAVRLLRWNTPLEKELSADVFLVSLNGQAVDYQGRMVKRGAPGEQDYLDIPAGGRVEARVDIARYYDVAATGSYTISYKPYVVDGVVQLNQQTPVVMDPQELGFTVAGQ